MHIKIEEIFKFSDLNFHIKKWREERERERERERENIKPKRKRKRCKNGNQ
jgi:hypothetical protein